MHREKRLWIAVLAIAFLELGCEAEDPHLSYWDTEWWPDSMVVADFPANCPQNPTLQAPILSSYSNPTSNERQPFRGTATGAARIMCRGGAGDYSTTVGSDGKFCLECRLFKDATNKLTFIPIDSNGCWGREKKITIVHKSSTASDAGVTDVTNVAIGQTVDSDQDSPEAGQFSYLVDDDTTTAVKLSFFDLTTACDTNTWLRVDLGKTYTVSKLVIRYPSNVSSDYATCYTVLLSDSTSPVDPDTTKTSDWTTPTTSTGLPQASGTSATQEIEISPQSARWAALLLYENGATGLYETFNVAELEVWGVDPNATPTTPPDSCSSK